jgi:hypothetical protein
MITKEVLDVCPFDLDEPSKLWRHGVCFHGSIPVDIDSRAGGVLMSELDAWQLRARLSEYIIEVFTDPYPTTLEEMFAEAHNKGWVEVVVVTGTGRVIERYPV